MSARRRCSGWIGESQADVARSYGLARATVSRMVRSARLSGGLEAGLVVESRTTSNTRNGLPGL